LPGKRSNRFYFLRLFIFKLEAHTGQRDLWTDEQDHIVVYQNGETLIDRGTEDAITQRLNEQHQLIITRLTEVIVGDLEM